MKSWLPIILLAVITVLFFSPEIIQGEGFLYGDNLSQRIPNLRFFKQEVLQGRIPLWNPFILAGIPFLADLSNNLFAPTNLFYLILPVPVALSLLVVVYVWLAAAGTYIYVYELTRKAIPSFLSAVAFAFSGTLIAQTNDINSLQGIAFIPVVLFASHLWISDPSKKRSLWLIGALAVQFISSHPQYSYYTWLIVGSYLLLMKKGSLKKAVLSTASIFALMFGLVAVQLIPFLELSNQAYRPQTVEFGAQNQLKAIEFPRLIFANFYGSWKEGSSWGPGSQMEVGLANTEGYSGLLPLALAAAALFTNKRKVARFWAAVAAISFLVSLGNQTPVFGFARIILPLFDKFRSPIRALALFNFSVAILAGLAVGDLEKRKSR